MATDPDSVLIAAATVFFTALLALIVALAAAVVLGPEAAAEALGRAVAFLRQMLQRGKRGN